MDEMITLLEQRIKNLIKQQDGLKLANKQLHQSQSIISREKALLLAKQKKLISQIESMVEKLKGIEKQL